MQNLHADILELFVDLDGYGHYEVQLERWSAWRIDSRNEYQREYYSRPHVKKAKIVYAKRRYREEIDFRRRARDAGDRYRDRVNPTRKRRTYGPYQLKHGTLYAYVTHHCRCASCRAVSTAQKRKSRANK